MIDQAGKLYLGREFDLAHGSESAERTPFTISARELTTHAVCLGMTGTGKTGLGVCVLEELLLQDIPLIIIDPKGDISNLMLQFPDMSAASFAPWIDPDEAARQNLSIEACAAQTAARWKQGLADSDIGLDRLQRLRDRVDFQIFTPGSDAGIPVNVLQNFNPPTESGLNWISNVETLRERIAQICSALLGLIGIDGDRADPIKGREHILLATLFESAWRAGQPVDLSGLIQMVQSPPVTRVGAFDMDVFYPKGERFELAMALNNLSASPSFAAWQGGQSLDIADLLKRTPGGLNPAGRIRANIFYLAHLGEEERQFFVTLLLSQVVLWMRGQSGTPSLRCLVYFDEVFGYCPPFPRNPPTKAPLMTIIKQGRAAGLGMFLSTQNPADLDYKGLSNIGTWFIGRLRTGRDRDRALEGLEGAAAGLDRAIFDKPLATLPPRVFLAQSITGQPRFLQTRWAMSYLRGPLTRDQISRLLPQRVVAPNLAPNPPAPAPRSPQTPAPESPKITAPAARTASLAAAALRPQLPPDIREVFLTIPDAGEAILPSYAPHLLATAAVRITDRGSGTILDRRHSYLVPLRGVLTTPTFSSEDRQPALDPNDLSLLPEPGLPFDALPFGLTGKWLKQAERALVEHLYRHGGVTVLHNPTLKLYSGTHEPSFDFRHRCEDAARERRDAEANKLRTGFERRMIALQRQLAQEGSELASGQAELSARKREELLSGAESMLNWVIGRRDRRALGIGASKRRQTQSTEMDIRQSEAAIQQINAELQQLAAEYRAALAGLGDKWARALSELIEVPLLPKKSDIFVDLVALAWVAR